MFKNWIIFFLLTLPLIMVKGQNTTRGSSAAAPASLLSKFDDHFPDASDAFWKINDHGYTVTFVKKSLTMTAHYNSSQTWEHTDIILPRDYSLVPSNVSHHVKSKYNTSILGMGYYDSPAESYYKIKAQINNVNRILKYDDNGNYLGME